MHPLLKAYNLFNSNGVDILSGFHAIHKIFQSDLPKL